MERYMERALSIIVDLGLMTEEETLKYDWKFIDLWDGENFSCYLPKNKMDIFFPFTILTNIFGRKIKYSGKDGSYVTILLCGEFKNTESETEYSITIDNFRFKIISKSELWDIVNKSVFSRKNLSFSKDYLIVTLESEDTDGRITTFKMWKTSGLWRILNVVIHKNSILLDKGSEDYVQQTMIHCDLQLFVNRNIGNIRYTYDIYNATRIVTLKQQLLAMIDTYESEVLSKEINDSKRIVRMNPFWDFQQKMACGETHKYSLNPREEIFKFSKILENSYDVGDNFCIGNYSESINKLTFHGSLNKLHLNRNNEVVNHLVEKGPENVNIYYAYSKFAATKSNHIFTNRLRRTTNRIDKEISIVPFLITPSELTENITRYGFYTQFIPAGVFVCKNFEYLEQVFKPELKYQIEERFAYIGDRHDPTLFPFSEVDLKLECPTLGGTRKKYKKKTNKRYDRKKIRAFRRIRTSP